MAAAVGALNLTIAEASLADYEEFRVNAKDRKPLVDFMLDGLKAAGCRIIHAPSPTKAPFRITFEAPDGERIGIIAYAFLANNRATKNRPGNEHRFQIKYGSKQVIAAPAGSKPKQHELWQDPYGLYTTLLVGINPDRGIFVSADPVLHNPTKFFISLEFKEAEAEQITQNGWFAWERDRFSDEDPVEVLAGGTRENFLRCIRLEREALGEDQGHRMLLAERPILTPAAARELPAAARAGAATPSATHLHVLAVEFELSEHEVLTLIGDTPRLKMAVRGWIAEEHLVRHLRGIPGVTDCTRLTTEGSPDVTLRFRGSKPLTIECKNVLRKTTREGLPRLDFQRTRASKADPCSRYYRAGDFDIVAACVHAVTERWDFRYSQTSGLGPHPSCSGRLSSRVHLDKNWDTAAEPVLRAAVEARP
jgi:hypothetical protein